MPLRPGMRVRGGMPILADHLAMGSQGCIARVQSLGFPPAKSRGQRQRSSLGEGMGEVTAAAGEATTSSSNSGRKSVFADLFPRAYEAEQEELVGTLERALGSEDDCIDAEDEEVSRESFESRLEASLGELGLVRGDKIGSGSVADIYRLDRMDGTDCPLGDEPCYAVKLLKEELRNSSSARRLFKQEAKIWNRLKHRNVVNVVHYDIRLPYVVMDLVKCGHLFEKLQAEAKLDVPSIAMDVACALKYMHENDVVHRDIKSLNVLLDVDGSGRRCATVCDFGSAMLASSIEKEEKSIFGQMDRFIRNVWGSSGAPSAIEAVGTPFWMAPEMLDPEIVDLDAEELARQVCKLDVYSFGVLLYELTHPGKLPWFHGDGNTTRDEVKEAIVDQRQRLPLASGLSREVKELIQDCWDPEMSNRPEMSDVVSRLSQIKSWGKIGGVETWAKMSKASIVLKSGERIFLGDQERTSFGRSPQCTVRLTSKRASRRHAYIEVCEEDNKGNLAPVFHLVDESTNGTTINKTTALKLSPNRLVHGDVISVGEEEVYFSQDPELDVKLNDQ